MINELVRLATDLDKRGLVKEANYLDAVIRKIAETGRESVANFSQYLAEVRGTSAYADGKASANPANETLDCNNRMPAFGGRGKSWQADSQSVLGCAGSWAAAAKAYRDYFGRSSSTGVAEWNRASLDLEAHFDKDEHPAWYSQAHDFGYYEKMEEEERSAGGAGGSNLSESDPNTGQQL